MLRIAAAALVFATLASPATAQNKSHSLGVSFSMSRSALENGGKNASYSASFSPTRFIHRNHEIGLTVTATVNRTRDIQAEPPSVSLTNALTLNVSVFYRLNVFLFGGRIGVYGGGQAGMLHTGSGTRTLTVDSLVHDSNQALDMYDLSYGPQAGLALMLSRNMSLCGSYQLDFTKSQGKRGTTTVLFGLRYYY